MSESAGQGPAAGTVPGAFLRGLHVPATGTVPVAGKLGLPCDAETVFCPGSTSDRGAVLQVRKLDGYS
jgi:hypothetical protein